MLLKHWPLINLYEGQKKYLFHSSEDKAKKIKNSSSENTEVVEVREKNKHRYYLGGNYPGIYLTLREAQCVKYLSQGSDYAEIGAVLGLAERTVEYYVKKIRKKLSCRSRKQVLAKIENSDFYKNYTLIDSLRTNLDVESQRAIRLLERLGVSSPSEDKIELIKKLLATAPKFKC